MKKHDILGPARWSVFGLLLTLLPYPVQAAGDPVSGGRLYQQRCAGCHTLDADRVGPRHRGVVGRKAGSVASFAYSPALKNADIVWNAETLDRWLADPQSVLPGQKMNVLTKDAAVRADIIAFLSGPAALAAR